MNMSMTTRRASKDSLLPTCQVGEKNSNFRIDDNIKLNKVIFNGQILMNHNVDGKAQEKEKQDSTPKLNSSTHLDAELEDQSKTSYLNRNNCYESNYFASGHANLVNKYIHSQETVKLTLTNSSHGTGNRQLSQCEISSINSKDIEDFPGPPMPPDLRSEHSRINQQNEKQVHGNQDSHFFKRIQTHKHIPDYFSHGSNSLVLIDDQDSESSITNSGEFESEREEKDSTRKPKRVKRVGKRKSDDPNHIIFFKQMTFIEKESFLKNALKRKNHSLEKMDKTSNKSAPQDRKDTIETFFIKGHMPNFWQCPHCRLLPLHERAKYSVLYHGDSIPPTREQYPTIQMHLDACEAKQIIDTFPKDLTLSNRSIYSFDSVLEAESYNCDVDREAEDTNGSDKKKRRKIKSQNEVINGRNKLRKGDRKKDLKSSSHNNHSNIPEENALNSRPVGITPDILSKLNPEYLEILTPLEFEIAWVGERRMNETNGRWLDWEFIMKNCSPDLKKFFNRRIELHPDKYKNHKMDVFIRNKARVSFTNIRNQLRAVVQSIDESSKPDRPNATILASNQDKKTKVSLLERGDTLSNQVYPSQSTDRNDKVPEEKSVSLDTEVVSVQIPEPGHNLIQVTDDLNQTASIDLYLLSQVNLCFYSASNDKNIRNGNQLLPKNLPGVECKYCKGSKRRFFFKNEKAVSKDLPKMEHHILRCKDCPKEVKNNVIHLRAQQDFERTRLRKNAGFSTSEGKFKFTRKYFGSIVWKRLHEM